MFANGQRCVKMGLFVRFLRRPWQNVSCSQPMVATTVRKDDSNEMAIALLAWFHSCLDVHHLRPTTQANAQASGNRLLSLEGRPYVDLSLHRCQGGREEQSPQAR